MRRRNPSTNPEEANALWRNSQPRASADTDTSVTCALVTPMYGGGVTPGEIDCSMPIRASAIRGALRFWWRLLYSGARTPAKAFEDECALWGGIASEGPTASRVALRIIESDLAKGHLKRKSKLEGFPPYALILKPRDDPQLLDQGYTFKVALSVTNEQRSQVIECLRWWVSFGGVGARTRRGLGAIKATGDGADLKPVSIDEVKRLGGWMATGPQTTAQGAWRCAVGALRSFRQGPGVGRGRVGQVPGRSNWPEAQAIRQIAGEQAHAPQDDEASLFPRAAFGLPIVFQFKGEKQLNDTLEGEGHDRMASPRMASPLILRPYYDGERYRAMALLLPGWRDRVSVRVKLSARGRKALAWPTEVEAGERKRQAQKIAPMAKRADDPLTAFMRYFEETVNG